MATPGADSQSSVERFGYQQELKRSLSFSDLLIYGLIFMVPIAPMGIFGAVFTVSGGMVALAYIVGMIAMAFTAVSYVEMSRAMPLAGSVYTYAGRGISPWVGFLAGWQLIIYYVVVPALLYIIASAAMHAFVPAVPVWLWVIGFVAVNTVINYFGIEMTARTNKVVLVGQLAVLAIFLVVGLVALAQGKGTGAGGLTPVYEGDTFSLGLVFAAVSVAALSFLGFDAVTTLAEENQESSRQLGKAVVAALGVAGTLFIVQTWVAALLVPDRATLLTEGDPEGVAFYQAAEQAGGRWLYVLCAVATAIAWGFTNAMVAQAATSRVLYSMARDRQLPAFLSRVHPRYRVPENATFVVAAVSLVVGVGMSLRADLGIPTLATLVNFGALTVFILLHLSVIGHYALRERSRDWPRHVAVPVIGIAILVYVLYKAEALAQAIGLVWIALGLAVLIVLAAAGRTPRLAGLDGDDALEPAAPDTRADTRAGTRADTAEPPSEQRRSES